MKALLCKTIGGPDDLVVEEVSAPSLGPDEVRIEVQPVIDAGVDIIAPECAVPLQTPVNNLKTIVEVCQHN